MIRHVAVVVPARDEEELVDRCLGSITVARGLSPVPTSLVVVLDACTDGTAAVVAGVPGVRTVVTDQANVGAARALGVSHALAALPLDAHDVLLACTDADSEVPPWWIAELVRLADEGADVVVGTVRPDPADLVSDELDAWTAGRVPGVSNGHAHGANLAVRASSYLRAGGFPRRTEHEDVTLVASLRATGARVVPSDAVDVLTSGRRVGRTPGGYAGLLDQRFVAASRA
ncbi:glycosyltransferase [Cellulomonas sp. URHB0016]